MANPVRTVVVKSAGGGSAAGILLLLIAVVGLVALFSGNLDRLIGKISNPSGGAAGITTPTSAATPSTPGGPVTRVPTPAPTSAAQREAP